MPDVLSLPPVVSFSGEPIALLPAALPRVAEAAKLAMGAQAIDRARAIEASQATRQPEKIAASRGRGRGARAGGSVAVVPLTGVLTPHGSLLSFLFGGGGGGVQAFRDQLAEAVNDPDVGAIVLDVDSPGGRTGLVAEAADDVAAAAAVKDVIAVCNIQAASGAYWIASQATEVVVTRSGWAGSIGVYMVHEDWSLANAQAGITPTYISAGKFKTEGHPDAPLSEQAEAAWQAEVDLIYADFTAAVAAGRGTTAEEVAAGYGEGRVLLAEPAVEAGLADRVGTLEEVVAELLEGGAGTRRSSGSSALATRVATAGARQAPATTPPVAGAQADDDEPPTDDAVADDDGGTEAETEAAAAAVARRERVDLLLA